MKPGEQELRSDALQSLNEEEKPKYENKFQARQIKKQQALRNATMHRKPLGEKKKRPGPRLRNALKAQKLLETKDRFPNAENIDSKHDDQNVGPISDARVEENPNNNELAQEKKSKSSEESKDENDAKVEIRDREKSHRKRKRRRSVKTDLFKE